MIKSILLATVFAGSIACYGIAAKPAHAETLTIDTVCGGFKGLYQATAAKACYEAAQAPVPARIQALTGPACTQYINILQNYSSTFNVFKQESAMYNTPGFTSTKDEDTAYVALADKILTVARSIPPAAEACNAAAPEAISQDQLNLQKMTLTGLAQGVQQIHDQFNATYK
jgi:hypothetical protein